MNEWVKRVSDLEKATNGLASAAGVTGAGAATAAATSANSATATTGASGVAVFLKIIIIFFFEIGV